MPPRKGIVKSGNAGNSKSAPPNKRLTPEVSESKPLFPPGSKYPLTLLRERCQKNGWDKPIVDTYKQGADWSFSVTLSRTTKKGEKETVKLTPHPAYVKSTALEAMHWGATYALHRFCNGMQLHRVLPDGPREYWMKLASEQKAAPEHQKWMYEADPFTAKKGVEERQTTAAGKREAAASAPANSSASHEFDRCPEVKMAPDLREIVEDSVKKAMNIDPIAAEEPFRIPSEDFKDVVQQLETLGFTPVQARKAADFFAIPSSIGNTLLASQGLLEACLEYLILHIPECDLPERFLPSKNSSDAFIVAAHVGTDDIKTRWIVEKATKEAGWPIHVVRECLNDSRIGVDWDLLVAAMSKRLLGEDPGTIFDEPGECEAFPILAEDVESLGASFDTPTHIVMPLFGAPIQWHILISPNKHPRPGFAPMYLTSTTVPAYIRLHMLSCLLPALQSENFDETGGGFCLAGMAILDEEWAKIEDNGPPSISVVFQHFSRREATSSPEADIVVKGVRRDQQRTHGATRDPRSNALVKASRDRMRATKKDKFDEMTAARQRLPAFKSQEQFFAVLRTSRVVVVVGETGCGKTTQLPQFILDSLIDSGQGSTASIIITQPRRISAIGVSSRVSAERLEDNSVGYAIRGENTRTRETKLLFCTTGVVLRRLSSGDKLSDVTHVVVDEVHERSVDGDFLLLELRELLNENKTLKVILMSATINHGTFIEYFGGAPLLSIPGFTYPVKDVYLEDVISSLDYHPPPPRIKSKDSATQQQEFRAHYKSMGLNDDNVTALQNITRVDDIDYKLLAALIRHIVTTSHNKGGVLIFLPGVQEIRQCMDSIRDTLPSNIQADILPLHANLSSDEQRQVFKQTHNWKIIASTNVAETSITIDDVIFVVDSGKVKQTRYDGGTGVSRLVETWVTRAEARQRRGRAGRTQPGTCYKLYTKKQEGNMGSFAVPEILRVPLESISLSVKVTREDEDVRHFLKKAIDPPDLAAMDTAWNNLENMGAVDEQGKLTALGRHISLLPIDLRLAKMLVLGTVFRCLGPILTIAACLSSKALFVSPMEKRQETSRARAQFSEGTSDLLTDLKAYDEVIKLRQSGKPNSAIRQFCEENFISSTTVREVSGLRIDFLAALANIGFVPQNSKPSTPALNSNSDNANLLKAVILGGLWPRIARVNLPQSAIKFDKVSGGTVQRENIAKEYKMFDLCNERVFLHPASVLFDFAAWKSQYVVYFSKVQTTKLYLRDATEVPLYAILLFGGPVTVSQVSGGLTIGGKEGVVKLKAWPRIGILVNMLRRLLDAQLQRSIDESTVLSSGRNDHVIRAMLALLAHDGAARS